MADKRDHDAEATNLLCFSSPAGSGPPTVQICLGVSLPSGHGSALEAESAVKRFFTVNLTGVLVSLPQSPGASGPPVTGLVNIHQSLQLSVEDMKAMHAWLTLILAPGESRTKG